MLPRKRESVFGQCVRKGMRMLPAMDVKPRRERLGVRRALERDSMMT